MSHFRFSELVLTVSCLTATLLNARPFDAIYSFGDSLTDAGTFQQDVNTLVAGLNSSGRFTVNPGYTYAMDLAEKLDLQDTVYQYNNGIGSNVLLGGTNYSQGAAGVKGIYTNFFQVFNIYPASLSQQVSQFLMDNGGEVPKNSLLTLWGGDNDIQFGFPTSTAPNTLPSVGFVASQGQIMADLVHKLKSAGAKKTVVLLAANPANTPKAYGQQSLQAQLTELTDAFNQAFLEGIEGVNVLVIDPNPIFAKILENPSRYGFAKINQFENYATAFAIGAPYPSPIAPDAEGASLFLVQGGNLFVDGDQFVFADITHPTPKMHQILADTVYSMLRAPGFMAAIPNIALANSLQFLHTLESRLYSLQDFNCDEMGSCPGKFSVYAQYDLQDTHLQGRGFLGTKGSGLMNGVTVGTDYFISPSFLVGTSFNYQNTLGKVDPSRGHFRLNQYGLNFYTQGAFDCHWIGYFLLSGGYLGCHSVRDDLIDGMTLKADGDLHGQFWAGEAAVRYQIHTGKWLTGPKLSYLYDYVRTNSFSETGDITALKFNPMHMSTSRVHLGWDTEYGSGCKGWRPFLQLAYEWSLGKESFWVDYGMVNYSKTEVKNQLTDSFNANAGVRYSVSDLIDLYAQGGFSWFWSTAYTGSFDLGIQSRF